MVMQFIFSLQDGQAMLWDLNEGKHLYTLEGGDIINSLCFSPNRYWLCAATGSSIKIWVSIGAGVPPFIKKINQSDTHHLFDQNLPPPPTKIVPQIWGKILTSFRLKTVSKSFYFMLKTEMVNLCLPSSFGFSGNFFASSHPIWCCPPPLLEMKIF